MALSRDRIIFNTALIGAVFVVIVDRFCKVLALSFGQGKAYSLIGDFLSFAYSPNSGLAFSLPSAFQAPYFILPIIIVIGYLFWKSLKQCRYQTAAALGLVVSGAISNLYDRLAYGQVIDYLDVRYFTIFNLADALICLGVAGLIIQNLRHPDTPRAA